MNNKTYSLPDLSSSQWAALVILRISIGWHLLYQAVIKISDPGWTSAGYLKQSTGLFSGLFQAIAESPGWLLTVDILNQWALFIAGFALIAGLLTKAASYTGMILLLLYYLAQPPFFQSAAMDLQGDSLVVNMVLIEAAALYVLSRFPSGQIMGIDRLFLLKRGYNDGS